MSEVQEATLEAFDAIGAPIGIGDRVVYAINVGSSPSLRFGEVTEIKGRKGYAYNKKEGELLPSVVVKIEWNEGMPRYRWSRDHVTLTKLSNILVVGD
jgi:hypothetical protein